MSHHIISRYNTGWNLDHPAIAVVNHLVIAPGPWNFSIVNETNAINFKEFEGCLVNGFARAPAVSQVGNHRAMMRIRPCGPLKTDPVSSGHHDVAFGIGRIQMTDNIVGCVVL